MFSLIKRIMNNSTHHTKKKVVLITPMLQPYRISFYDKLSKRLEGNTELIIYHGTKVKEDGRPAYNGEVPFKEKGFPIKLFYLSSFKIVRNVGMYKSLKKDNPDMVIIQGIGGDISLQLIARWTKKHNKKLVFWACGWEEDRPSWKQTLKNMLVVPFYKKGNYHLTYSNKAAKYLENMGISNTIIETCYNGIEIDDLLSGTPSILKDSKEVIKKYKLENYTTFLYVGGLLGEKRVDLLIDAFSKLRSKYSQIKLVIIGDGPEKSMVEEKLKNLSDQNIYYLGRIVKGVDTFFAASDCLVLPGVGGLALNQGMFWGKTCIASKADGTEDDLVIEGVTGYRFNENNLDSLTSAMERRINEKKDKVELMSENARQIILTKSNVNNMVDIFFTTISNLLNQDFRFSAGPSSNSSRLNSNAWQKRATVDAPPLT
jgi:glycosyltransferase involved in cell wall biosynthesis